MARSWLRDDKYFCEELVKLPSTVYQVKALRLYYAYRSGDLDESGHLFFVTAGTPRYPTHPLTILFQGLPSIVQRREELRLANARYDQDILDLVAKVEAAGYVVRRKEGSELTSDEALDRLRGQLTVTSNPTGFKEI